MTMNKVTYETALEIASHEAMIRQAYRDSVGKWTWSVGLTSATGHNVERYIDDPAALQKCLDVYVWALKNYARQVNDCFKGHSLTDAQFTAALSFHWNTGAIDRAAWVRHFKAGNLAAARSTFMNWQKPPEVKARRQAERDLFFYGRWSNVGTMAEYTELTARHTPKWSSRRMINVEAELVKAFAGVDVKVDHVPQPDAPVTQPTLSPKSEPSKPKGIPMFSILGIITKIGGSLFRNAGVGSWLGRLTGLFGVGQVSGANEIVGNIITSASEKVANGIGGIDVAGLPWYALAIGAALWALLEAKDFDFAGILRALKADDKKE